jgi:uncharacterized protein (DUF1684 family)
MRLRTRVVALTALSLSSVLLPASAQSLPPLDQNYRQQFEEWKAGLDRERREQWLTLAGLFWLKAGENRFGSAADNPIVFPKSVAAHEGVFLVSGRDVTVKFEKGVHALVDSVPLSEAKLAADVTGHPTLVQIGRLRFGVIQRGERTGIRLWDMDRPEAREYLGATFYPLTAKYRLLASWVPYAKPRPIRIPNVLGDVTETQAAGEVRSTIDGREFHLIAVSGEPDKGFFLIFSDPTRKSETYPAGRFLETGPVKNGEVVLDFNYAYNPPCALTAYATCPLPPQQNQLTVPIPAGEKYKRSHRNPHP